MNVVSLLRMKKLKVRIEELIKLELRMKTSTLLRVWRLLKLRTLWVFNLYKMISMWRSLLMC